MTPEEIIQAFKELPQNYVKKGVTFMQSKSVMIVMHPELDPIVYANSNWKVLASDKKK